MVERPDGSLDELSIIQTLMEAPAIRALYEPSPLDIVAVHRLLVAILQAAFRPQGVADLAAIWRSGRFATAALHTFAETYAHRFDLFAEDVPFMQSADLPLYPAKGDKVKPVGYLLPEQPAGTAVTHYNHAYDDQQQFCSCCAAKGLLAIPAFASSGGAGIKPSINGVPPIYVLPGGETLFDSLAASLTMPQFEPSTANRDSDLPWWEHPPIVAKKGIVKKVGYLHSLTFPARRVRLHPLASQQPCTRCGQTGRWHVATMVYEMGESRPKDAAWWRDPFAAYRSPKNDQDAQQPTPVRPLEGRAVWREFSSLFLPTNTDYRPAILNQLEEIEPELPNTDEAAFPVRVIGLRTDMKMKIFEWQESGFALPPRVLSDVDSAKTIEASIEFAIKCNDIIRGIFRIYFGGGGKDSRLKTVNAQMSQRYWQQLGHTFHSHIQHYTPQADTSALLQTWVQTVIDQAQTLFEETVETLPDDGATLRRRIEAINHCRAKLWSHRNKTHPQEKQS